MPDEGHRPQVLHTHTHTHSVTAARKFVLLESIFQADYPSLTRLQIGVSGTRSLTSGAPSRSLAHVLILLTNFRPSGSFTPPFLLFLHSLTNPAQPDSRTKIGGAPKRQLERLDFRSRRRQQNFLDSSVSHDLMRRDGSAWNFC